MRVCWRPEAGTVGGRPVRSLVAGTVTDLPEVVLVPGLGAPGYLAPWVCHIATWTRATVLDLPGWRWGRATACVPTVAGVGTATARWLAERDRRDIVLLGHSTGAQAAVRTALLVPDRLAGVVLAGPTFDPAARSIRHCFGGRSARWRTNGRVRSRRCCRPTCTAAATACSGCC